MPVSQLRVGDFPPHSAPCSAIAVTLNPPQPADADKAIDQAVEASGNSASALLVRSIYRRMFNLPGVDADLDAALQKGPHEPEVLMAAADRAMNPNGPTPASLDGVRRGGSDAGARRAIAGSYRSQ